jgi:mannose-1-phosphate guanylyltransferase
MGRRADKQRDPLSISGYAAGYGLHETWSHSRAIRHALDVCDLAYALSNLANFCLRSCRVPCLKANSGEKSVSNTWAVVLAAGEGSRLKSLTTTRDGLSVPKQFCSLNGGASLLGDALRRAEVIAMPERICVVVAEQHRQFWEPQLDSVHAANIIVQPANRGTATGILLPLLHILARDPDARIALLPSDHHVREESVLGDHLCKAVSLLEHARDQIILLGMEPDELDPDLGYIVPGARHRTGLHSVQTFFEKPSDVQARELMLQGALWNVFIMAARGRTLLKVFTNAMPATVAAMREAIAIDRLTHQHNAILTLYRMLPDVDFSRDIAQKHERELCVIAVPACGWSDLGTPRRVGQALLRTPAATPRLGARAARWGGLLNLANQHALISGRNTLVA